jgi:DNA-binding NtrC family response regulator
MAPDSVSANKDSYRNFGLVLKRADLAVVSFAPSTEVHGLQNALQRLNLEHKVQPAPVWLDDDLSRARTTLLFVGSEPQHRDRLPEVASKLRGKACLTLVPRDDTIWDTSLITQCNDFACWPCSDRELALRLGRVGGSIASTDEMPINNDALSEFASYGLLGQSDAFRDTVELIAKVSRCDVPVLLEGETGTGKDSCARAIHYLGARRDQPFIPINCGALPDSLMENELFGHEKGAYTDAKQDQTGLIAQAQGGSLFLDEIEALSLKGQVTLLRFLEDLEYRPLGGKRLRKANLRLIAASNQKLASLVESGEFRRDLFYRLNVVAIGVPCLKERQGDIKLLAEEFIRQASIRYQQPIKVLHANILAWMDQYAWPGNVRELENFVHRAYVTSAGAWIDLSTLNALGPEHSAAATASATTEQAFSVAKLQAIREFEQRYLSRLMAEAHGNVTLAAKRAGKERRALGKLLKKYHFDRGHYV